MEVIYSVDGGLKEVPSYKREEFKTAIAGELLRCVEEANGRPGTLVKFHPIRRGGTQHIAEFEVLDLDEPRKDEYNWHGQNTSQWLYAGAVVFDESTGRVSTHH